MNRNKCKKCVFYGGKRKREIVCLTDKSVSEKKRQNAVSTPQTKGGFDYE